MPSWLRRPARRQVRAGRSISVAVLTLLLVACGASDQPPSDTDTDAPEATAVDRVVACELVPAEDVTDILGMESVEVDPIEVEQSGAEGRYLTGCTYTAGAERTLVVMSYTLTSGAGSSDPEASLRDFVAALQEDFPAYQLESVPELGAGAGWHAETQQLVAYRPNWQLIVGAANRGPMAGLQGARTLAARVLERLP